MEGHAMKLIHERRSIRAFQKKEVAGEDIKDLLEAAVWAPSGGNIQPWIFGVVRKQGLIRRISAFSPGLGGQPTALFVLCIDMQRALEKGGEFGLNQLAPDDLALAAQNIMLLATEKGLGTCLVKSFQSKGVAGVLKLPDHIKPSLIITLGYPISKPKAPRRRPVVEVTFYDQWEENDG